MKISDGPGQYDKAKAELLLAETQFKIHWDSSPFDGIIDRFLVREGSLSLMRENLFLSNFGR